MPFCRPIESCLMRATRCLSLKRKALNYWVKHNHIVPHNLWDPFEGDHVILGRLLNCKAMCGGSRWESKTGRVNLCEVGGVSLPLNIGRIKWRLISRCYQHWKLSRSTSRYTWTVKPGVTPELRKVGIDHPSPKTFWIAGVLSEIDLKIFFVIF